MSSMERGVKTLDTSRRRRACAGSSTLTMEAPTSLMSRGA